MATVPERLGRIEERLDEFDRKLERQDMSGKFVISQVIQTLVLIATVIIALAAFRGH